jgi:threonine dehydrogenase-like Zn-dependent dehydrogenase
MKAIRIEEPGFVNVVEIPSPQPLPGEALLKVRLVGMCGTDLNTFRGRNSMVAFPRVIGHEVAGSIVSGGDDLAEGTLVTLSPYTNCGVCPSCLRGRPNACVTNQTLGVQRDGAMTEYIAVPREKLYPANLSLRELCLVEPLTVGFHAVSRGRVTAADGVAIFGCGGIGLGAIAASVFRHANTIAIDMDSAKLEVASKAGANHTINSRTDDLHSRLQQLTNGRGPDVVIEAIGLAETFRAAVEEVAFTGRVVYIGYAKEPVCYETRLFVQKELDIMGSRNALPEDFLEVIRMLEGGAFPVEEAISVVVPMDEAPAMLAEWSAAHGKYTKIMVQIA